MGVITVEYDGEVDIDIDKHLDDASREGILKQAIYNGYTVDDIACEVSVSEIIELLLSKLSLNDAQKLEELISTLNFQK